MLFKEIEKLWVVQLPALLLVVAFAIAVGACPGDDVGGEITGGQQTGGEETRDYVTGEDALTWGTSFDPLTLGLTPGNDTTEIYLNWYSSGAPAGKVAQVRFIRGTRAAGTELIEKEGTVSAASSGNTAHKVAVTGLKPGSSYQYSVSTDGTNWSPAYDLKIPAATGTFRFAVIADAQITTGNVDSDSRYPATTVTTAEGWKQTMEKVVAANVSFIASCGDQVDASAGNELEYTNFFAPPGLRNLPFAPTGGNHDNHLNYNYHFNWPNSQPFETETANTQKGRNYFYRYNNILFVVLNTGFNGVNSTAAAGPHIQRFDTTLTVAKEAHAGKYDWLIVQHHKSTASVGDHVADRELQYFVEAGFEKIMSDHDVDFVLAGHDHVYARTYPLSGRDGGKVSVPDKSNDLKANAEDRQKYTNPGDPIYLTFTTASGLKYYAVSSDPYFPYGNTLYLKSNAAYPYLGESTTGDTASFYGSTAYMTDKKLPVSNAKFVQPYIPSYTIVDVDGKTITFKTYAIADKAGQNPGAAQAYDFKADTPYDWVSVTKN